ncbi:MAG: YbaB/EbfC family nucleoid-associated protein [Lentisphaerae bacterium]|nr:YbaB/EbfC family nucleoid-associated protein [Lentisphaerota bacterium]
MANFMQMIKQATSLQRDMKKVQKELASRTVEYDAAGGRVRVVARGDLSVASIDIAPEYVESAARANLGRDLAAAVNGALAAAKKEAGREMAKITSGLGLPADLLG